MFTFFTKAGKIMAVHNHPDKKECTTIGDIRFGENYFAELSKIEYAQVRYEDDFKRAFDILGGKERPSSVAGAMTYTFVGDEARTLAANICL